MSHPVNDMIMDQIIDTIADMSAHEKHLYLFKNKLQTAYREDWNDVIAQDMFEKRMEQSV
tara:strand:- start:460 stop:639 length:180 start_codon:yes stop_codon:yes gene_type:complete